MHPALLPRRALQTATQALLCCVALALPALAANPLFPQLFTADPAVLVDGGRVYLYTGHDEALPGGKDFVMNDWRVFSSCDMQHWRAEGVAATTSTFAWAKGRAWASDIARRGDKYYFYATLEHASVAGFAIGVAVADSPTGPFVDALGKALVTNDMTTQTPIAWDDIDPAVFVDQDGQAYLYWGNTVLKYARLKSNMVELDGPIQTVALPNFTEAAYLHRHGGLYYLSYSQHFPEETAYATGPSATGPWTPRGVIMGKNQRTPTIHQAITEFNGRSYIVYHNAELPGGGEYRRSVAVEELHYLADGSIAPVSQTLAGPTANPSPGCH
jgi:arabinoxylan arabinofuranohydrolase